MLTQQQRDDPTPARYDAGDFYALIPGEQVLNIYLTPPRNIENCTK